MFATGKRDDEVILELQVLKERNKYDRAPLAILDRLQRISLFADKVADEIVCKETEILDKVIDRKSVVRERVLVAV